MSSVGTLPLGSPPAAPLAAGRFVPTEIDLFMFCAATWNTHRIHFDRDYARAEGYRDLVVPGPLQSARLAQLLADFAGAHDGRLHSMSVRHHTSLYCNEPIDLRADLVEVRESELEVAVVAADPQGVAATSGRATLVLAPTARAGALVRALRGGVA
jgi:hydroxyacyl-ACP dehydratase HTD2-like protein with hotdog domain